MPTPKNKRKFALWLYPETLEKIGQLYTADDCRSKSEFISESAASPALIAIGSVAGVALLGNLGLILFIVLKKKKSLV